MTDIYHNISVILLGDWQKTYMHGLLDDLFAIFKEDSIHYLDIHTIIEKLEVCSKTNSRQYTLLSYLFYQQDP